MQVIRNDRSFLDESQASGLMTALGHVAMPLVVASVIAAILAFALTSSAPSSRATAESIDEARQKLSREWVWKKTPARFDHMWRVPY